MANDPNQNKISDFEGVALPPYGWSDSGPTPASEYLWPTVQCALQGVPPGARVLDLGCGNGWASQRLAGMGFEVVGMDASLDGIENAPQNISGLSFVRGNVYDQVDDFINKFDIVVSTEVVEHLFLPRLLFERAYSYLKPGGIFLVSTPYHGYLKNIIISLFSKWDSHHTVDWDGGHIKFFSRKTLKKMAERHGFSEDSFFGSGRVAYLWKSMVVRFRKP